MAKALNLEGERFGRLTVIEKAGHTNYKKVLWKCICDCGNYAYVDTHSLTNGRTKSCGCIQLEKVTKHGNKNTRIWRIWQYMKGRCKYKYIDSYKHYGGRGIKVCEEWDKSFESFYKWSMEHGYTDKLSIDRIDVNGNYEPSNCRWATSKEQSRNKRTNVYITYNGETRVLKDWAEFLGIDKNTLWGRINISGWSIEDAFNKPVRQQTKKNDIEKSIEKI